MKSFNKKRNDLNNVFDCFESWSNGKTEEAQEFFDKVENMAFFDAFCKGIEKGGGDRWSFTKFLMECIESMSARKHKSRIEELVEEGSN